MAKDVDEALKNCAFCKKPVSRRTRYYRNSVYYCNQNCWRSAKVKAAEEAAAPAEGES